MAKQKVDIVDTRAKLQKLYEDVQELVDLVIEDHKEINVCTGYMDFAKTSPTAWLQRAEETLAKKDYKVALVGPFKAGKSTFLSALLQQPGMLPAEDAECTFSVGVVSAPGPDGQERVEVTYYSSEVALRNILDHTRYAEVFLKTQEKWEEAKRSFSESGALSFIKEAGEGARGSTANVQAEELLDFCKSFSEYKSKLGTTQMDSIDNLKKYVRKEEGIGHLLLIQMVRIYRNNPVLAKQGFQIADTPGTDSMNEAARKITFGYLEQADAIVYLAEARGLSTNFEATRKELEKYNNEIRNKVFVVANKADGYEVKSMRGEGGQRPKIEDLFNQIVNPMRALRLNEEKLFFTVGRLSELNQKRGGAMSDDEEQQYNTIKKGCQDKLNALSGEINPRLKQLLQTAFTTGGVDEFREVLIEYLSYEIQFERLKEIFSNVRSAYDGVRSMLDADEERIKDLMYSLKSQSQEIQEFFDNAVNAFAGKVDQMIGGVEAAVNKQVTGIKSQLKALVERGIDRFPIERVRRSMPIQVPLRIKIEVISQLKMKLSELFAQAVKEKVPGVVKGKLHQQVEDSQVPAVMNELAKEIKVDYDKQLKNLIEAFDSNIDEFTRMRALEETWELLDTPMQPAGTEARWNPQVEKQFREDLKKIFVDKLVGYASSLDKKLGRHYQSLMNNLIRDFERLMQEVKDDVKKDPDQVQLPVAVFGGDVDDEEIKRQRALMTYWRSFEGIKQAYDGLDPVFA